MKYIPHPYQDYCIRFAAGHTAAGLLLGMGLGKTSIALTAADQLLFDRCAVSKVLVIAPLRVAEDTWSRESEKWDHLRHLRVNKVLGSAAQRRAALAREADIYCINRENTEWLVKELGKDWPFQLVIVDELSSFRNPGSRRFRALRRVRPRITYLWGLTGTPRPRSLLDLWAQVYLLDQGERLGRTFGEYKRRWFTPGRRNGAVIYEWLPRPGAEKEIYRLISGLCVSMQARDYLDLPERVTVTRPVILSPEALRQYRTMERDAVLALKDQAYIDAGSAAAVNGKLLQMAGGAVYDGQRRVHRLHDAKLEVLEDVLEEAAGQPVLVAYRYQHERDRIRERFPQAVPLEDGETIAAWNRGEIPLLLVHPAGAGHGLNLQEGGHIAVWFGPGYDLELDQQFNARLHRQGQRETVTVVYLVAQGTVEEEAMKALETKADGQEAMLEAVRARLKQYEGGEHT